jgi:transmembrane sensor
VLSEGSAIELTTPEAELVVESDQPQRIAVRLSAGGAHFDVVPNLAQRQFSVVAGAIEVVVVGTVFDVTLSGERVHVAVTHGKVRVLSPAGVTFIAAGESREFDDQVGPPPQAADDDAAKARTTPVQLLRREPPAPRARPEPASNEVDGWMDAADAARQRGHLETAALYLRKVVSGHRESPATPLAAFTLGRLLLERLGRPGEAAAAFATARELAPAGSLASDALAREVEAWSKAGHADLAADRARVFLQAYPSSRRARVMELYLDPQP